MRIVKANSLDLSLFQFDYDLTFAAFLNSDGTIYGRFGTRSRRDKADEEMTLAGFRRIAGGCAALHREYPANRASLAGKQSRPVKFKHPEEYPSLQGKYLPDLDYAGNVAKSCIHCHQVREAEHQLYRSTAKQIPDPSLFPYPMPDTAGLKLNPDEQATVLEVSADSPAGRAGFRVGDRMVALAGQPLLSLADVQWVLHNAEEAVKLSADVDRDGERLRLTLDLPSGWRRASNISWRPTTWDLRRMGAGGLVLDDLADSERAKLGLAKDRLALLVKHVGEYGAHAVAKRAGFQKGDVIVAVDGQSTRLSETQFLARWLQEKSPGIR